MKLVSYRLMINGEKFLIKLIAYMRFQVLMAASMKMVVFWDFEPCRLLEIDRRFGGFKCFHHQGAAA
jgi:hypothetical protein